ncbi:MAG: carbohydrate-binding protein [Clostridia bacterium]|nr:carbohydrate-binding protein [Clostridia bacterium]
MIKILALDREQTVLAEATHPEEAMLCVDREWQDGDHIEVQTEPGCHLMVRMDVALAEGEVYLPDGKMSWPVPQGEHRLAYASGTFHGGRHIVTARAMNSAELLRSRDLARNPADLRGETNFFPHCTANVETRNESVFAARNVIDGLRFNTSHGEWPFESWGIGARTDAYCKIDFGRDVIVERMALTLRADFPHDAYWVSGHVTDSNGDDIAFDLQKTGERQWVSLGGRRVRWLQLERMVKSDDPSAFPSLRAWEVYGHDLLDM